MAQKRPRSLAEQLGPVPKRSRLDLIIEPYKSKVSDLKKHEFLTIDLANKNINPCNLSPDVVALWDQTLALSCIPPPQENTVIVGMHGNSRCLRTCRPPSFDALLRPTLLVSPSVHRLMKTTANHHLRAASSPKQTATGTSYDQHMPHDLRLRMVAPMPKLMMDTLIRRWKMLVDAVRASGLNECPVNFPDIIGEWYKISQTTPTDDLQLQARTVKLLEPVFTVIARIILAAAVEGVSVNPRGTELNAAIVSVCQPGNRAATTNYAHDYRVPADLRQHPIADVAVFLSAFEADASRGVAFFTSSRPGMPTHTPKTIVSIHPNLCDPRLRVLAAIEVKPPEEDLGEVGIGVDLGQSFCAVRPQVLGARPHSSVARWRPDFKSTPSPGSVSVPEPSENASYLPLHRRDPCMGAMHHQDEAMSRWRNAESDRLRESGSMEDEIKNDPWPGRMYNTLEQLGLLFINESVVDLDDRLVHAVMKLRGMADQSNHLPTALSRNAPSSSQPLPSLHEMGSSGLNPRSMVQCRLQQMWREMVASGTFSCMFTNWISEFRIGMRDPSTQIMYLSSNYLPQLGRLPVNVPSKGIINACEPLELSEWLVDNHDKLPTEAYLPCTDEDSASMFEVIAAVVYEAMQHRLITCELRYPPTEPHRDPRVSPVNESAQPPTVPPPTCENDPGDPDRSFEADMLRLRRAFEKHKLSSEADELTTLTAHENRLTRLVSQRHQDVVNSRTMFFKIYDDVVKRFGYSKPSTESNLGVGPPAGEGAGTGADGDKKRSLDDERGREDNNVDDEVSENQDNTTRGRGPALDGCAYVPSGIQLRIGEPTELARRLREVACRHTAFSGMAFTIHDDGLLASPEPALFEPIEMPPDQLEQQVQPVMLPGLDPGEPPTTCLATGTSATSESLAQADDRGMGMNPSVSMASSSSSTSNGKSGLSTGSTTPPLARGSPDGRVDSIAATRDAGASPHLSPCEAGVLCVDARTLLGRNDTHHVWGAIAAADDGITHGIEFLAVKMALSPRGHEELQHEMKIYAHLARAGSALTQRVNIPQCYGLFRETPPEDADPDTFFPMLALVMSLERGECASEVQSESQRSNLREAVEALHARGVCHLDLAPRNVLVHKDGSLTIIDFGRALLTRDEAAREEDFNALEVEFD